MNATHDRQLVSIRRNQQGMVSLTVTLVLMIVLTLIVIGFAQITRRNSRQALDRQLNTQAFYAAESGVNDARELIKLAIASGSTIYDKSTCGAPSGAAGAFYSTLNTLSNIDSDSSTGYTCLLVDPSPTSLEYGTIGNRSTIIPLTSAGGTPITSFKVTWQTKIPPPVTPTTGCPTDTNRRFVSGGNWLCGYGLVRFDMVPVGSSMTVDSLTNAVSTIFAVPLNNVGTNAVTYNAANLTANSVTGVRCTDASCVLTVNVASASSDSFYLRMSSIYQDAAVQVTATDVSGSVELVGSQVLVDSTGKSQDTLRRIQVRVPVKPSSQNQLPDFAFQAGDSVCKRFSAMQGYYQNSPAGIISSNPQCI